jgi:hypothetical protein
MAHPNSMKKSSAASAKIEELLASFEPREPDLEFPVAPDFDPKPPRLPWPVIFKRSEENLPYKIRQPDFEKRRLAAKCRAEFVL